MSLPIEVVATLLSTTALAPRAALAKVTDELANTRALAALSARTDSGIALAEVIGLMRFRFCAAGWIEGVTSKWSAPPGQQCCRTIAAAASALPSSSEPRRETA